MYFFAMEMTSRRFASTISFFARRAFASPIDMRRLISLISVMETMLSRSVVPRRSCSRLMSFENGLSASPQG